MKNIFKFNIVRSELLNQYEVSVLDIENTILAKTTFKWKSESIGKTLDIYFLSRDVVSPHPFSDKNPKLLGKQLFDLIFSGSVGKLWDDLYKNAVEVNEILHIVLCIDPNSARSLLNLPWEYLHDDNDFLVLVKNVRIYRTPWGFKYLQTQPVQGIVRVLICASSPVGLDQNQVLNSSLEEDLILDSLSKARESNLVEVEYTVDGSIKSLEETIINYDPHILHFTGHGGFSIEDDMAFLLMETPEGNQQQVPNNEFASLLERTAKSLYLVFLSACQTSLAPASLSFLDIGSQLTANGLPSVIAMQFTVLNRSAMQFVSTFYQALGANKQIHDAVSEARNILSEAGLNQIDFATPVLFLRDPFLKIFHETAPISIPSPTAMNIDHLNNTKNFIGRRLELRLLQKNLDPKTGKWNAVIIYGIGGIGKSVLANRLVKRIASKFDGVKGIRLTPASTARDLFQSIALFIDSNKTMWVNNQFSHHLDRFLHLEKQVETTNEVLLDHLIELLKSSKLLLVIDNFEYALKLFQVEKTLEENNSNFNRLDLAIYDRDFKKVIFKLLSVTSQSRLILISRVNPHLDDIQNQVENVSIGRVKLSELQFRDAIYLMESTPLLKNLPFTSEQPTRPKSPDSNYPISKQLLFNYLGGHPHLIQVFSKRVKEFSSMETLINTIEIACKEDEIFISLNKLIKHLSNRELALLQRFAIFNEPVPTEALAFLLDDTRLIDESFYSLDATPGQIELINYFLDVKEKVVEVNDEIATFSDLSLLDAIDENLFYVTTPVRLRLRDSIPDKEKATIHKQIGNFWLFQAYENPENIEYFLKSRKHFLLAKDFEVAASIALQVGGMLINLGLYDLLVQLMKESVATVKEDSQPLFFGNIATAFVHVGKLSEALEIFEALLTKFDPQEDKHNIAVTNYYLGMIHEIRGEHDKAELYLNKALSISEAIEDISGQANALHLLGLMYQKVGRFEDAKTSLEKSLLLVKNLKNPVRLANTLSQLGILASDQKDYKDALNYQKDALAIRRQFNDKKGIAVSLHQIGMVFESLGKNQIAWSCYREALEINEELDDKTGMRATLHHIGGLYLEEGNYEKAQEFFMRTRDIEEELGDPFGLEATFHQLGRAAFGMQQYEEAEQYLKQALELAIDTNQPAEVCKIYSELGLINIISGNKIKGEGFFQMALDASVNDRDLKSIAKILHASGSHLERENDNLGAVQLLAWAFICYGQPEPSEIKDPYKRAAMFSARVIKSFSSLGLPSEHYVLGDLDRLRSKLSDKMFKEALSTTPFKHKGIERNLVSITEQGIQQFANIDTSRAQKDVDTVIPEILVRRTVSAIKKQSTLVSKDMWLTLLKLGEETERKRGNQDSAEFMSLLQQLINGKDPEVLEGQVPSPYRETWDKIISEIRK